MEVEVEIPGGNSLTEKKGNGGAEEEGGEKNDDVGKGKEIMNVDDEVGGGAEERKELETGTGYNKDKPPEDDCCPICFGEFKVPCKANCGHWFCGNCILQLWKYRSRPRRCKCPFCNTAISKLSPEASAVNDMEKEAVEVLEEIKQYNHFYVKGLEGFYLIMAFYARIYGPSLHLYTWRLLRAMFMILITTPSFIKRAFVDLIRHPERIGINYQRIRLIACTLSLLLHFYHGFLPPGHLRLQITKMRVCVDGASILLVVLPYAVVMCKNWIHIWWLKFQIWQVRTEVEALRVHNANLRAQEEALRTQADALKEENAALEQNAVLVQQTRNALRAEVELVNQELADQASLKGKKGPTEQTEADSSSQSKNEADLVGHENMEATEETESAAQSEDSACLQGKSINASREMESSHAENTEEASQKTTTVHKQGIMCD